MSTTTMACRETAPPCEFTLPLDKPLCQHGADVRVFLLATSQAPRRELAMLCLDCLGRYLAWLRQCRVGHRFELVLIERTQGEAFRSRLEEMDREREDATTF